MMIQTVRPWTFRNDPKSVADHAESRPHSGHVSCCRLRRL